MAGLLTIENLQIRFETRRGIVQAVDGVDLEIGAGETIGLVGESGCGKSVTGLATMGIIAPGGAATAGRIEFNGTSILDQSEKRLNKIRGHEIAMIFQDPLNALNPVHTAGRQIVEALRLHRGMTKQDARAETVRVLAQVGIPDPGIRLRSYPHQLSGGMAQRVMIAMALACRPKLLIADEPTTALDVTIQAQILALLRELRDAYGTSILLITHDLGVVAEMADRVAVMYCGRIVETAAVKDLFAAPRHPYTQGLLESCPRVDRRDGRLRGIGGSVPRPGERPAGCLFAPRCGVAVGDCAASRPPLERLADRHDVACFRHDRVA